MTDQEFDFLFSQKNDCDMMQFLGANTSSITLRNGKEYHIDCYADILAVVEQEMYERLTGRE
jgi:hypothetical protein